MPRFLRFSLLSVACLLAVSCQKAAEDVAVPIESASVSQVPATVSDTYLAMAQAGYGDSLTTARELLEAVNDLLDLPSDDTLQAARAAWIAARVPYQQTEAFRFGNPVVDEWEGRVNAWPLDEGLIDYTAASYGTESDNNYFYTANIIANPTLSIGGITVDATTINTALLQDTLHEIDGVEANVATGYHAIEFLLWGQDLHGTSPGAGERPWTDYSLTECSNGNCDRRRDYLLAATTLLVNDLQEMTDSWQPGGAAYEDFVAKGDAARIATMLTGMGELAYGELATERVNLGLLLNDPEEEHDCFSDNTHWSHYYDAVGIENIYRGRYARTDGTMVEGPSLEDMLVAAAPDVAAAMDAALAETRAAMTAMVEAAAAGQPYDVLIASDNVSGEAIVSRVFSALQAETRVIEDIISALDLQDTPLD